MDALVEARGLKKKFVFSFEIVTDQPSRKASLFADRCDRHCVVAMRRNISYRSFNQVLLTLHSNLGRLAILTLAPTLVVRAARRNRVEAVEQDLAPTLELLATLAEAGLSFDSGIARIQESETGKRPLTQEFQIYQRDALGFRGSGVDPARACMIGER